MSINYPIPETRVLAIASHVVYGYVGNTMATHVMQALGCEVSGINTVHFSNHTGYRQFRGRRTPAEEIQDLYAGLQGSYLTDFDMLLTGYSPSAEVVEVLGGIARDLRFRRGTTRAPGRFFWVLDPVMGDQGRLYVDESVVGAYRSVVREADLVVPNQFEVETLTGVDVVSMSGVRNAVEVLHGPRFGVGNVVITSVRLEDGTMAVVGSTSRTDGTPRLFKVEVPVLDCYFSGTGDMFAALMVVRLREACMAAGLMDVKSWIPPDHVEAVDLPLAKATEKVLASMQTVLQKTMRARDDELRGWGANQDASVGGVEGADDGGEGKRKHLAETKAAEVRLVRNTNDLLEPNTKYKAVGLEV